MKSIAVVTLMAYVFVEGIDSPLLKWMQRQGENMMHLNGGDLNPIRFSNVYFFSFLLEGIILLMMDYRRIAADLKSLDTQARQAIAGGAFSGMFVGPLCYFESINHLSVIGQSLLFSLLLPISALFALLLLKERLPRGFGLSLALITAGLVVASRWMGGMAEGGGMDPLGIVLVLISVLAYATYDITNRSLTGLDLGQGVTVGIGAIVSAASFAAIEVTHYGLHTFQQLQIGWVLLLVGAYGLVVRALGGIVERGSLLAWPIATVELWGSLAIVVSVFCAAIILGDPANVGTLVGVGIVLAGVCLPSLVWHQKPEPD